MKKLFAIILTLSMLLTLCGCGMLEKLGIGATEAPEEEGIAIVNELGWSLTEIYIVKAGSKDWGEPVIGDLQDGVRAYLYPESTFGSRKIRVDIRAVDFEGDYYEAFGISMTDGDKCVLDMTDEGDFIVSVAGEAYKGNWIFAAQENPGNYRISDLEGMWELVDEDMYVLFYSDMTWESINGDGDFIGEGTYELQEQAVLIVGDDESAPLYWESSSVLFNEEEDTRLEYVCSFDSETFEEIMAFMRVKYAYFNQMGYEINYEPGDGWVTLETGGHALSMDGTYYERFPVDMMVTVDSVNETEEGYVEVEFTETVYLDSDDFPWFVNDDILWSVGTNVGLYDYYAGYQLSTSSTTGDTSQEDNTYYFEYESQDRTVCIDYSFDIEWVADSDGSYSMYKHSYLKLPANYDGIIFGMVQSPVSYEEYEEINSRESGPIPMVDSDAEDAVFCRIYAGG